VGESKFFNTEVYMNTFKKMKMKMIIMGLALLVITSLTSCLYGGGGYYGRGYGGYGGGYGWGGGYHGGGYGRGFHGGEAGGGFHGGGGGPHGGGGFHGGGGRH